MDDDLPIGSIDNKFGKWSPSWEGPFKVVGIVPRNSYMLQYIQEDKMPRAIIGKYYPNVWQDACKGNLYMADVIYYCPKIYHCTWPV